MSWNHIRRALVGLAAGLVLTVGALPALALAPTEPEPPIVITPTVQEPVMAIHPPEQLVEERIEVVAEVVPTLTPEPIRHIPLSYAQQNTSASGGNIRGMLKSATIAAWGEGEWDAMNTLMGKESGTNPYAVNKSSGACGIAQAYPCSKMLNVIGSLDNFQGQVDWTIAYIRNRYRTPSAALAFHRANGWY